MHTKGVAATRILRIHPRSDRDYAKAALQIPASLVRNIMSAVCLGTASKHTLQTTVLDIIRRV